MVNLSDERDASVISWAANTNYGDDNYLMLTDTENALIGFDISGITPSVSSAKLWVYGHFSAQSGSNVIIRRCLTEFVEMSVTWNNRPSTTDTNSVTGYFPNSTVWRSIDVTDMLNDAIAAGDFFDIDLRTLAGNTFCRSREGSPAPYLEYVVTVPIEYDNIYVDPVNGLDTNSGAIGFPLASLSLAASRVNSFGTVNIKSGSVWSPSDGQIGPTNKSVIYRVY